MPCTKYKKLPLELQHFLVIHHDKSGPDIYKYLLFPPANRQERERLRLGLRYYKEAKVTNPEGFQRLLEDAVNFFAATPPTSLEYLCLKQLAITPPKTPHKTTSPFRLGGRRESLAFIQPDDDSSFEGSVHSSPVVTPAAKRVKANPINADKKCRRRQILRVVSLLQSLRVKSAIHKVKWRSTILASSIVQKA